MPLRTFLGTIYDDNITANDDDNYVMALLGDDRVWAGGGNDTVLGDIGNDTLSGGFGNDVLDGGAGDDVLIGGPGVDRYIGGFGLDNVCYSAAEQSLTVDLVNQNLNAGEALGETFSGVESITAGEFSDIVRGDEGANWFSGLGGDDLLDGRGGDDRILAQDGADTLIGGAGSDTLDGGNGDDLLVGGVGYDVLTGGAGADTFRIEAGTGTDYIVDFVAGTDRIEVSRALFADYDAFVRQSWTEGSALVAEGNDGSILVIQGGALNPPTASDFFFV